MQHEDVEVPNGDIIIHSGDALSSGSIGELQIFIRWFMRLPHRMKVYVPGNHDVSLAGSAIIDVEALDRVGLHVLIDRKVVDESGLSFYGVPWTTDFLSHRWVFNYCHSGRSPEEIWSDVPDDTDVLISHGPPRGWADRVAPGREHLGCSVLAKRLAEVKPKLFVCGHIHGGYGVREWDNGARWVNASVCTERYQPNNPPVIIDVPALPHR
jgi:Icc-related predicted phosphoesterase